MQAIYVSNIQKCWREGLGTFDVRKLWELTENEETRTISINDVKHNLNKEMWSLLEGVPPEELEGKEETFISPNEILENPELSPFIMDKINSADTKYAILVYDDGKDLDVLDGLHRLSKLVNNQEKTVKVKYVTSEMLRKSNIFLTNNLT